MIYVLLALLGGAFLSIQVGVNNTLKNGLGNAPLWAAFVSFFVGACSLFLAGLVSRAPLPTRIDVPVWAWLGGVLGGTYVVLSVVSVNKIGAATFTGCVVAGQILAALVIDHFGWLQVPQHPLSIGRVAGVLLLGLGVYLVRRF